MHKHHVFVAMNAALGTTTTLTLVLLACVSAIEILPYNPVASDAAVVLAPGGTARFTVLTERMIRMEYASSGAFEDRATIAGVD